MAYEYTTQGYTVNDSGRRLVVDPVTRIEGHLRCEVNINDDNVITSAGSCGTMFRGLEIIVKDRVPRDIWAFVERICGVCTGIHALAAVRSVEDALGIKIPKNANIMRNLVKKILYADVAERGATAVITSHSLRELEDTCDQLALLHKGGIVFESDVQNLKTTLFKVQIAFDHDYDHTFFRGFDVLNFSKHGSVSNLIVRGDRDRVVQDLRTKSPILMEALPLSLEEVFLYEMESLGYTFDDEIK